MRQINIWEFFIDRFDDIMFQTMEHATIVITAMAISIAIGATIGVLITFHRGMARIVLNITSFLMTIPSLALFSLLIPILGIGRAPAIVGLVLYTLLPVIRNVYTGIINIDPAIIEAAKGMGISPFKIMFKIKIPLAFPVIMAGVRTAVVMGIGIGAIAAYIGAGGLGDLIFKGINRANDKMVIIGAIMVSVLTLIADKLLSIVQHRFEIK